MSWRTVIISNRCKLDLNMGYMVVRGEETKRIFLDEIGILMLENPQISMTGSLLSALSKNKTRIIFCDEKRNPYGELEPYYGCHDSSRKIRNQIKWSNEQKGLVWTKIVIEKLRNQSLFLREQCLDEEARLLEKYIDEIEFCDASNREGHAAKVYFNALFGKQFSRAQENPINSSLNYGYGLILSAVNREVAINGYTSQLGIFHDNIFNPYNLSSDLMEPLRILIDRKVIEMGSYKINFDTEIKREMIALLNNTVRINNSNQTLLNAIKIYCKSVFDAINKDDLSYMRFPEI